MKFNIFSLTLIIILSTQTLFSGHLSAQDKSSYSKEVESKIKLVENGLAPWVMDQDSLKFTLEERMARYNVQGLSIAVIRNYKVEWAKGYGWADVSQKRRVSPKTLFQAGSISKSLNAVGLVKLSQDRKLDLEADINNYLTTWKFPYDSLSKNKKITLSGLLSHTAGISGHGFQGYTINSEIPSIYAVLDGKKPANSDAVRSMYEPGKQFEYSGGGITISQLILTDITHKTYEEYMQQEVLNPLGMRESFFTQPPVKSKKELLATGYQQNGKQIEGGKYNIYPEQAAAGLWSNPVDLSKYVIDTQLSLDGRSDKVLSQEFTKVRLKGSATEPESALGVFIETKGNEQYFYHTGGTNGFLNEYIGSFKNGNGVVIMTNSANQGICREIINSVAIAYNWKNFYEPEVRRTISLPENTLDSYTGNYAINGQTFSISKKGNELWLSSAIHSKLYFTTTTDFFTTESKLEYKFIKNSNGEINGFTDDRNRYAERVK
jgi:CubicO group peptidase (beta-lactamase class C family)